MKCSFNAKILRIKVWTWKLRFELEICLVWAWKVTSIWQPCCRPTNTLKFLLAPSLLAIDTLYFSLKRRKKRNSFRLRFRLAEKWSIFCTARQKTCQHFECWWFCPFRNIPAGAHSSYMHKQVKYTIRQQTHLIFFHHSILNHLDAVFDLKCSIECLLLIVCAET